jgi:P4 family phage/plasmid primase-like protien
MKLERALAYIELGWPVFPLIPNSKKPLTKNGFKDASTSAFRVTKWWTDHPDANIGIATGQVSQLAVLDVDVKNGAKGLESLKGIKGLTPTLIAKTPSGGWHYYYLLTHPLRSRNGLLPGIDLKADGGYVVAPGSTIDDVPYEWFDPEAHQTALPDTILEIFNQKKEREGGVHLNGTSIIEGARNSTLASLAGAMRRKGMEADEIAVALKAVNTRRCSPPLPDDEIETISASIARYPPNGSSPNGEAAHSNGLEHATAESPDDDPRPPGFTDDALALEFTAKFADDWRYVAGWGKWFQWDGKYWQNETTLKAFDLARLVCRAASSRCQKPKIAAKVASAPTVAAVERLTRADRRHAATTDQWDADPWLLNTTDGVQNLLTAETRNHERTLYMTKIAPASFETFCPTWLRFLNDVTEGDADLQHYLARVAGYALTGVTSEHVLFFLYGTGANGKSVFVNTLAAVWGDYATTAPMDTFMVTKGDRHPTDLAKLRGARLVIATEVSEGNRWDEAKIKVLTGGDIISARFMRQDFFDYKPQFKLMIAGNHKPSLRNVDEAMKRRLHLIPFTVTIPPAQRDKKLSEKLLKEKNGILGWALEGCREWRRIGLNPPPRVLEATEEYFEAQDALGRWIAEACLLNPNVTARTSTLFASWKKWAEEAGEYVGAERSFSQNLAARGYEKVAGARHATFIGLAPTDEGYQ